MDTINKFFNYKNENINNNIIVNRINNFESSKKRQDMIIGENYYEGKHDILSRKRTAIGANGELTEVENLPNNKIVDNQYKKMVSQKVNYLLGRPITVQSDNDIYAKNIKSIFNKKFQRILKSIGEDSLNCGIGWLFLYYNKSGELSFKRIKPYEIIPGWSDSEHNDLDYAIRIYNVSIYDGKQEKTVEKVEIYNDKGIFYFELLGSKLNPCEPYFENYFTVVTDKEEQGFNWIKIPLIPFKYNNKEIPLINMVKSLQDGLNTIESNFQNRMEEDTRNTILVLVNYDGENLGEFRKNLAQYGAVKVRNIDGAGGDVKTLQVEVNSENYKSILEIFKKAIIENAMGYDAKDDRMQGTPNQMNIKSMYSDIDLDTSNMETEYQASFEELLWFINAHLENTGKGNFENEDVDIIFNRNMVISETELIDNCTKSVGLLSDETIIARHPWIDDVQAEMERIKKEKEEDFNDAFKPETNYFKESHEEG